MNRGRIFNFSGFGAYCIHISNTLSAALVGGDGLTVATPNICIGDWKVCSADGERL